VHILNSESHSSVALPQDDPALWERVRDADPDAFAALFRRHATAVYNYAFRRTASWAQAEDVVQATFTSVWRRALAGRVDPLRCASARPVLLHIAGQECGNVVRSTRRAAALHSRLSSWRTPPGDELADVVAAALDDEAAMRRLREVLGQVPKDQRDIVELVTWSGCTVAEAAAVLGVPVGTAKSRLSRARTSLRTLIDIPEDQP
jgi:RNA polymerase sigma-70 factor (ECF subfamily)